MTEDEQLLQEYARNGSEAAFAELVRRHIDLVYSAALRVVNGDEHLARDIAQAVFTDLARKAGEVSPEVVLAGWLHRHTCFTASKTIRTERRRQAREQTAMEMNAPDDTCRLEWEQIAPQLDDSLNELSEADRDAVVLRYLKQQDFRTVGAALGVNEDTAQKRVSRALEKLRDLLARKGVTLSVVALGTALSTHSVTAAPAALAVSITAASLAGVGSASTTFSTVKLMAMSKLKMATIGAVVLACAATPLAIQHRALVRLEQENQELRARMQNLNQVAAENQRLVAERKRMSNLLAAAKTAPAAPADQQKELLRLRGEVGRMRLDATANKGALDAATAPKPYAEMFKKPEMKQFVLEQQKAIFSTTIEKIYGPWLADIRATPEQTATVKRALMERMLAEVDFGMSMMSGEMDGDKKTELNEKFKAGREAISQQIKDALGNHFSEFESYETTLPERVSVSAFRDETAGGPLAITGDQAARLTQAILEERQGFKFTLDLSASKEAESTPPLTREKLEQYSRENEQLGQRYLARAQNILTPEQLGAFAEHLAKGRQSQNAIMQMNANLFAPKASGK